MTILLCIVQILLFPLANLDVKTLFMKKVKIMLLSLLVLGVVGGVMAFKAKFNADLCTTPVRILPNGAYVCTNVVGLPLTCPNLILNVTTQFPTEINAWCTTLADVSGDCIPVRNCVNQVVGLTY